MWSIGAPNPARNRVTPLGDIEAFPLHGAYTGNRGILHRGREIVRYHAHDSWVTCSLRFNGRWNEQWVPHRRTWLYFFDEAVSLAAGHRPCAECRWRNYKDFQAAWAGGSGSLPSAKEMNRQLHAERLVRGTHQRRLHQLDTCDLPDGTFVLLDERPFLLVGDAAVEWTREGYAKRRRRPRDGRVTAITPPSAINVLRAGYDPQIHQGALAG
jgi:hypothetical protein